MLRLLKDLDEHKTSCPDEVPAKILKLAAGEVTLALTLIFSKSLSTEVVQLDWLIANISPIYKKGDRSTPSNYRPVSLTFICCRVLEHILYRNIILHLDHYKILIDFQHGFCKHHFCETQLIQTIHDLAQSLDNRTQIDMVI